MKYDIVMALADLCMAESKMPSVIITSNLAIEEIRKLRAENESLKAELSAIQGQGNQKND